MVKIYIQEGKRYHDLRITRVLDMPRVPCVGEVLYFYDVAGPELEYSREIVEVSYELRKARLPVSRSDKVKRSRLESIIVRVGNKAPKRKF